MLYQKNHIRLSGKSYIAHTLFSVWAGLALVLAGAISIVHGVIPGLFPYTAEQIIKKLLEQSQKSRQT